jgi:ubiquinone/menaquinone biosynthesis C-methylase UbiE
MEQATTPDALIQSLFAFLRSGVLKAGIELDVFSHIAAGRRSAAEVATAAGADARATRILLDALAAQGLLGKEGQSYALSPAAEMMLVKDSPAYMGDFSRITVNPMVWSAIGQLGRTVRTGAPPESMVDVPEHEFWVEFSQASERASALPAAVVADKLGLGDRPAEVLDVAAGSGMYGFTVLEHHAQARLTSLDWQNVLDNARQVAQRRGVAERVTWMAGSAFEAPLPAAHFDAVIASHFYHHFSPQQNVALSKRLFAALKPGGVLAIHDWVADEDRRSGEQALMFAVVMLATTRDGDVYTLAEYRSMLEEAGFTRLTLDDVPMVGSQVILAHKA